ncbi:MAG: BMP family ABC transporter substrate-binding protein [Nitrospirales bacterium]|nr:BMP family ABC transporter substrate-binding protein [Nitrospirales bacterium]
MKRSLMGICVIVCAMAIWACGQAPEEPTSKKPDEQFKVGFIYVGPKDDYGYNYEHDQGRLEVEKQFPDLGVMTSENIPETAEVERVMEQMIQKGAKLLFPTSYGYSDSAINVGKRHPDVVLMHAGGFKHSTNVGTYWSYIYNAMFLSGMAAGEVTKQNVFGFVAAHPIPQTLQNINAFTLGARMVNPNVTTHVIYTGEWCNPGKASEAANALLDLGTDVLSQHQDCPRPVVETAAKRGAFSVGYHSGDLQKFNEKGWITGADWKWGELYVEIVKDVKAGKSDKWVNRHHRTGLEGGFLDIAPLGSAVPKETQDKVMTWREQIRDGTYAVFQGPIKDNAGKVRLEEGQKPSFEFIETMDWYAEGVVGEVPK